VHAWELEKGDQSRQVDLLESRIEEAKEKAERAQARYDDKLRELEIQRDMELSQANQEENSLRMEIHVADEIKKLEAKIAAINTAKSNRQLWMEQLDLEDTEGIFFR
jgi:hypothetical protein